MIERGMQPGLQKTRMTAPTPFISLKFGLLMAGLGLGLIVAIFIVTNTNMNEESASAVFFGFIFLFGGLGLVISYAIEKNWLDKQKDL